MRRTILTVATVFCLSQAVFSADFDTLRMAMLDVDIGPRAVGMAGAFTGMADDASAVFYNPAGLAGLRTIEIGAAADKWILDSSFQYATLAIPVGYGTIGGVFSYTDFGTFTLRDEFGTEGDQLKPYNISGGISYGAPIGNIFSAGLGLKFTSLSIDDYSDGALTVDAGILSKLGDLVTVGLSVQNIDFGYMQAMNIRAGAGVDALKLDDIAVRVAADVKYSLQYGISAMAGAEFRLFRVLSLRGGYCYDAANGTLAGISGLSAGAGINIDMFSVDYAFTSMGEMGATHLVGLKLLYEGVEQKEKKNYQKMTEFLAYQSFKDGEDAFDQGNYQRALMYWDDVRQLMPNYEGLDIAVAKAKRFIATGGSVKKAEAMFNEGMDFYEDFEFDKAVKKWQEVKKMYPGYKDIDTWISDAKELKASRGMSKQSERYFREGIKYYNNCDYAKAMDSWQEGLAKDPTNAKIKQYIERTKARQAEIKEGISKAKADVANDATVIEGVKRLRSISAVCPAYQSASDILATMKELITMKTKDYYFKGIEKYTDGNLDAAIVYWNNIEALDPKSEYMSKVRRYITDARNKQKAVQGMEKKAK